MATPQRAMSKCERRSRKTAALLAAWASDGRELGLDRGGDGLEAAELLVEEGGVGFVGGREVGPDAGQLEAGIGVAGAGQRQHRLRIGVAEPAHAAVVLDVDAGRPALGAGAVGEQAAEVLAPDRDLGAGGEDDVDVLGGQRPHRQQGDVLEAAADLFGLDRGRHRQPRGAAGQGRVGAAVGAVAVAVGLDHRAELGPVAQLRLQPGAVCSDRLEVDPGDRPLHLATRRRPARRARRPS